MHLLATKFCTLQKNPSILSLLIASLFQVNRYETMRLLLSTATISLANGHTLLSPSDNGNVANSLATTSTMRGSECSFVNSFKAKPASAHRNANYPRVDTGILNCPTAQTCVEDSTSSMGGRCISLFDHGDQDDNVYEAMARRALVACTFANGTSGQKCVGPYACASLSKATVGCGSCNGRGACRSLNKVNVAEGSCNGYYACYYASGGSVGTDENGYTTIGEGSCVGHWAVCYQIRGELFLKYHLGSPF